MGIFKEMIIWVIGGGFEEIGIGLDGEIAERKGNVFPPHRGYSQSMESIRSTTLLVIVNALLAAIQLAGLAPAPTLIRCDCAPLIASLTKDSLSWPLECASLIAAITGLLSSFPWVDVRYSPRSAFRMLMQLQGKRV